MASTASDPVRRFIRAGGQPLPQFLVRTVCFAPSKVGSTVGDPVTVKNPRTATSYSVPALSPDRTQVLAKYEDRHEETTLLVPFVYAKTQ